MLQESPSIFCRAKSRTRIACVFLSSVCFALSLRLGTLLIEGLATCQVLIYLFPRFFIDLILNQIFLEDSFMYSIQLVTFVT